MSKNLVIVESPAKAKTISRILPEYTIKASMGHIRDLPEHSFGVDIENGFLPHYEENKTRGKNLADLKKSAREAKDIYLASDPDREGEAIAWHLREVLAPVNKKARFHRVSFHEITKSAITRAFASPGDVDMNRVDAQQARRILDRIVGYKISPLLRKRVVNGKSAGRVQSVALRLVCEREREIMAFVPKEYWSFEASFSPRSSKDRIFRAKLSKINGKTADIPDATSADFYMRKIHSLQDWIISSVETVRKNRIAPPPFITSTLQQAASSALSINSSFTMRIAQELYEGIELGQGPVGLITYMRTDSVAIAQEAQIACRDFISRNFGADYVPAKPNVFKSKANAQGAHECIRPTDVSRTPESLKSLLSPEQWKVYNLIWKRFVACQMTPAGQETVSVFVQNAQHADTDFEFKASATATLFPGYLVVYNYNDTTHQNDQDDNVIDADFLKQLRKQTVCDLLGCNNEQKFTEPPPRFTEATLIKELESNGIGRPSTYATIVNTIQDREYVVREKNRLRPTDTGFQVNDFLVDALPELFQVTFTADMENKLDDIEAGKVKWDVMMDDFYTHFIDWLNTAKLRGAPENEKVTKVIDLLSSFTNWTPPAAPPGKKRVFDEHKFFLSVAEDYNNGKQVTVKQWEVLLGMLVRHAHELPGLPALIASTGISDDFQKQQTAQNDLEKKQREWAEARANAPEFKPDPTLDKIFAVGANITWKKPSRVRGRVYDDFAFFDSIRKQYEAGKTLTDKQITALFRLIAKYPEQFDGIDIPKSEPATDAQSMPANSKPDEGAALLKLFDGFHDWSAPVTSRGRKFDDREFIESFRQQVATGRTLSPKQLAVLRRTVKKYNLAK